MYRNRKTRLQKSGTPCSTNGSQSPPEHPNSQLMSPSNGHPSHPQPGVCVPPPVTLPLLSTSQLSSSPIPHNFSSFFHTTSPNVATGQPWVSPSVSSTHLHPLGLLGIEPHIMKHSSFVQTLPYTATFASKIQPLLDKPSPSIPINDQRSPSSHNSQSQPPFSQTMPSRYIRCQSPDSNSQSQPSSNEAEETHSDDEDESNAMSDHSNPAQDPVVDHESFGKVVEIVDESGNVTKKKDFKSKDIHKLRDGYRVLVQFNGAGQPIGDSRSALSRWMASLMKEPNLCPRDAKDFKEVKENYGAELLRNLRLKFLIPKRVDVEKALTDIFGIKFRSMRHKQNKHFFQQVEDNLRKNLKTILQAAGLFGDDLEETLKQHQFAVTEIEEELDKLPRPKDFSVPQWSKYKNYLKSVEFKKYSQNGKAARALKSHMHTTGTKSFAQCRAEFEEKNKRQAGYVEFFDTTHRRKGGSFVEVESETFMNDAKARMESHRASGSYATEDEIDKEVWAHFMGDDKPGRARLFGTGVTKSQVKRLRDGSLITRNDGGIVIDDATTTKLHHLQNVFVQQQNKMQQQEQMLLNTMQVVARLESQVALYQTALKDCRCVNPLSSTLLTGAHTYSGEVYRPQVPDQPVNAD